MISIETSRGQTSGQTFQMLLRLTPAPRAALLARDRARSDDLETDDGTPCAVCVSREKHAETGGNSVASAPTHPPI